jgi:hypothetical protein
MLTEINVNIYSWNCLENGQNMVLDVGANNLVVLNQLNSSTSTQVWTLVPNLVAGAVSGGYTIYNAAAGGSLEQPNPGQQIVIGDDPTPYGSNAYCWTLWNAGNSSGYQLWAIQDSQRGNAIDADHGNCDNGTIIWLYGWNGGDNQRWVLLPV